MTTIPRVRLLVIFKHGVAYLERSGPAEGPFSLSFDREDMNDVLKSLAVWVPGGEARPTAVSFEAPEDPEAALAAKGLSLDPAGALVDLVRAFRGRRVRARSGAEVVEGDVLGVDVTAGGDERPRRLLVLRTPQGSLAMVDLASVTGLDPLDDASRDALEFLVDRSREATDRQSKTVRVGLSGPATDVRVAYVIPAPVWRVSYRLVRDASSVVLMAWGIVHNPSDEDLEGVELVLTTGQPVSFVIDLYQPKHVTRATLAEKDRVVAAPTSFERGYPAPPPGMAPPAPAPMARRVSAAASAGPSPQMFGEASAPEVATGADRGELFEYRLPHAIDLKRGGSAMVPLLVKVLKSAKRERIWRDGTGESPDVVLTFDNDSGAVLEEGAAVVYDEGAYAGEAMLPYSPRGATVRLGFAKDMGLHARRTSAHTLVIASVRLGQGVLIEERRHEERHVVAVESDHDEPVELVVELARHPHRVIVSPDKPFEETPRHRRFRVTVPPRSRAELVVAEQWLEARHVRGEQVSAHEVAAWMEGKFLDQTTHAALASVLAARAQAQTLDEQRARIEADKADAYAKQEKIAAQLGVLRDGGQEGTLRLRYVKELEAAQDRVNAAESEARRLLDHANAARVQAARDLARLLGG